MKNNGQLKKSNQYTLAHIGTSGFGYAQKTIPMKKMLIIPLLLSFSFAFAGTGSANDTMLLYLAFIALMLFILVILYSVSFIRRIMKERRERRAAALTNDEPEENIG